MSHWLAAVAALALAFSVALLVLLVVVPVAVLVPLLIVALVMAGVLIVVAGVAALAFSPLIVCVGVVWLIWRLVRRRRSGPRPGATIAG